MRRFFAPLFKPLGRTNPTVFSNSSFFSGVAKYQNYNEYLELLVQIPWQEWGSKGIHPKFIQQIPGKDFITNDDRNLMIKLLSECCLMLIHECDTSMDFADGHRIKLYAHSMRKAISIYNESEFASIELLGNTLLMYLSANKYANSAVYETLKSVLDLFKLVTDESLHNNDVNSLLTRCSTIQ